MADDVPRTVEIRPAAERDALQRLNAMLELPADTSYATLSSVSAMKAIAAGEEPQAVAPSAAITPAPRPLEAVGESALPPIPPAPQPQPEAAAQAAIQKPETVAEGKFTSFLRNEQGRIRKGLAFAVAAVALGASAYGIHKMREHRQEAPLR